MANMKTSLLQLKLLLGIILLAVVIPSSVVVQAAEFEDLQLIDTNVSYIIEPFDTLGGRTWSFSHATTAINFTTEGALYGNGALAFLLSSEEEDLRINIADNSTTIAPTENNSTITLPDDNTTSTLPTLTYRASWIAERHPHNCHGASELSLAVKTDTLVEIQVSILDDRACWLSNGGASDCQEIADLTTVTIMEETLDGSSEWHHLTVPTFEILQQIPDLKRIRGWTIQVAAEQEEGTVLVDQFACHGSGDLLGAAFHLLPFPDSTTFEQAKAENMWMEEFFESEIARNVSVNTLEDGILQMDYLVQQVQSWGGFNDVAHLAAGNGYYNLSQATGISIDYTIHRPASIPERCIFRFVLQDGSHCVEDCDHKYHNQERWYSFNSIMDFAANTQGKVTMALEGSTEPTSPFWYTGWSGIPGNKELDLDYIKGYTIEVVLDSGLPLYDYLDGAVQFSNMAGVILPQVQEECVGVLEPDLYFHEWAGDEFTRIEFLSAICCEVCQEDPTCIFAMSNNRDCFIASEADPNKISLLSTEVTAGFSSYWMDDPVKRGDWCEKCTCDDASQMIDCRGRNLRILPKTINVDWEPLLIDLQDNPKLVVIGGGSFQEVGNSLEEIRMPSDMKFVSPAALDALPKLNNIVFEGYGENGLHSMVNAITTEADSFGDICCGFGQSIEVNWELTITTCDMKIDAPGIDAIYEPFYSYWDATLLRSVSEDATFMREAAESVEKCAEYCSIDDECNYFSYDQRLPNAEHTCQMYRNQGSRVDYVCCLDDHYADEAKTIPGTIVGKPPQSRHRDDNARVLYSTTELSLTQANNYATELTVSLGADPLRGSVWVYPKVTTGTSDLEFIITPEFVPLYTSNSTAKIYVSLEKAPEVGSQSTTVLVELDVASCDDAFSVKGPDEGLISLSVVPMKLEDKNSLTTSIVFPIIIVGALCVAAFVWYDYKRRQNDMIWKVKREELHFDDPPEVIGRGTFGLVLLAEYRGTAVAVKRVIPARSRRSGGTRSGGPGTGRGGSVTSAMSFPEPSALDPAEPSERGGVDGMASTSERGTSDDFAKIGPDGKDSLMNSKTLDFTKFKSGKSSDRAAWKKLKKNFIEEMRQLAKLRHPCICTVMGAVIGSSSVEPMLIMEYMDHGSLLDLLKNDTMVIDGEVILPILRDISQGMRFLHSSTPQVIHGDLKAANILVDRQFRAKVADFGLSQKKQLGGTGTPFWMAPELLRKEASNSSASDVFSFGVILIEVYSRKDPYEDEDSTIDILKEIADKAIQRRPAVPDSCPPHIRSMISDCLVDEAEIRPSFEEIDTRLKRVDAKAVDVKTRSSRIKTTVSLLDIFPPKIAKALQEGRKIEAEHRDCVTIFFSDIVNFTEISSDLDPRKVADLLDRLYTAFDALSNAHDIFKVETIGDAYMAVTNLVKDQPDDHAKRIAEFSIDAIEAANEILIDRDDPSKGYVNIRCGFHSGPVVADVVGNKNPRYCLFGDTVNSAHRMESNSRTNRIHCSRASADLLKVQCPDIPLRSRGKIKVKGKGEMQTYWVNDSRRPSLVPENNHPPVTGGKVFLNGMELALSQVDEGHETAQSEELGLENHEESKGSGHFSASEPTSHPVSSSPSITVSVQG